MTPPPAAADTPYARLTPEVVLDALDAVGLRGDGRLIQLNSYENRVFQVFLEDARVVVAKFYRPGRWSDAQILEEHSFAAELVEAEIPVVAPWTLGDTTLPSFDIDGHPYRFSVCNRQAGRAPELDAPGTLEWIGRFIGRIHAVGARKPFTHRLTLDPQSYGDAPRDWLLDSGLVAIEAQDDWRKTV